MPTSTKLVGILNSSLTKSVFRDTIMAVECDMNKHCKMFDAYNCRMTTRVVRRFGFAEVNYYGFRVRYLYPEEDMRCRFFDVIH